ncbi:MAG: right-handed parallel beta-helix repeat-containing protein, partial [Myxococcaceae bacterium]
GLASMGLGTGVLKGAEAQLTESAVVDNQHSGVFLLEKGSARLVRCAVLGTRFEPFQQGLGHGIFLQVDSRVDLTQTVLRGNAGIGVVFSESAGALRDSYIAKNAVGIHAQDGSLLSEVQVVPATVGPREVLVSAGTEFVGNATRVGSGTLQLPPPPVFNQPK